MVLSWLAGIVAVTTALALPFGFFQTVYQHEVSHIQSIAELAADQVSEYIYINSSTWRFQAPHLTKILAKIGRSGEWGRQRLLDMDGREILSVGSEVARHCRPTALRGDRLEASVDSSVWCQQLQLRVPEILAALRRLLGDDAPSELWFRVG